MWTVGESINVTCNDGFFDLNENTDRRNMTCTDDGWEELQGCVRVCPDDLEVGNATVKEKGSVWEVGKKNTATCIDDYLFVSVKNSTLEVACTEDGWEETEGCLKVCEGEPEVANGTTNWSSDEVWPEGSHVQGTCDEGLYLHPSVDTQQKVVCTINGWQDATPCEQVCFEDPDLSDEHAFWNKDTDPGRLGDEVPARCMNNYYNEASLNETSTTVRCTPDGWEAVHPCILSCREPPNFGNLAIDWVERKPGILDEKVWLDCPEGYRNKDNLTQTTTLVRCTEDDWDHVDTCVQVCEEDPDTAKNKIVWEFGHVGVVMNVVETECEENHYSNKTLTDNTTDVICTGNGWVVPYPCVRVCSEPPDFGDVPVDWGSQGPRRIADKVSVDCPDGYRNNDTLTSSTTTVSCTLDGWAHLDACVRACTEDPDAEAAKIKWESGFVATVDAALTVDCREDYYSNETLNGTSTQVRCLEAGWWVVHPCVRVCTNTPDFGDVTLEWDDEREPGRVSDEVTLACPEKHRSNTTLTSHNTTIICTPDDWVNVDPCVKVCRERLNIINAHSNFDLRTWTEGQELLVVCLRQHRVSPDTYTYTVPCTETGWLNVTANCSYWPTIFIMKPYERLQEVMSISPAHRVIRELLGTPKLRTTLYTSSAGVTSLEYPKIQCHPGVKPS
ncbi:complement factor H-related protein 4-like [Eriocheir sinensis]|uniref:complement factor H-related protein 4-like n=1 Tax=Eriocheir sinensis TaxID=95602 RepID=UPI0021C6664B|nr:complement factor H-related protein 4-like [Eriocheir sinensis]